MTEQEQINEMTEFLDEMWIDYPPRPIEVAEALYNADYRKIIWHKVADGDLPKKTSLYLCKMIYKEFYRSEYKVLLFNTIYGFYDNGLSITKDKVIAWTELPKYKD